MTEHTNNILLGVGLGATIVFSIFTFLIFNTDTFDSDELENKLIYTYSIKFTRNHDNVVIDSVRLYPNQLLVGQTAILDIVLESHENYEQYVILEITPYNTRSKYLTIEPSRSIGLDIASYDKMTFSFKINAHDVVGTYFTIPLEIRVYDDTGNVIDVQEIPVIITTSLEASYEELLSRERVIDK